MSRFSLRIPSQNITDSFEESKSPKPFRYSVTSNLDENSTYQPSSRSYVRHQRRIGQPLQSNLKLKKILVDKTVKYTNSERSMMTKKELVKFVENSEKVEKIIDKFNEFHKISKYQNERMGLHEIQTDTSANTGASTYLKTLSDSCSPRNDMSEGQKLMQKALLLCKKKKEYAEKSELDKIEEVQMHRETPLKQDANIKHVKSDFSGLKMTKPDSKQLKSDLRFRYVNRKVLLLRTLSQIAENENKPQPPKTRRSKKEERPLDRKSSIEERGSLLSCTYLSPRGSNTILDLKTESLGICSIEHIAVAKPDPLKLGRFSVGNYGVDKSYRGDPRTTRRDSVLSNASIADGISELATQNTSGTRSTTLNPYDFKIRVPTQKETSESIKSTKSSAMFNSRTRRLSTKRLPVMPSKQNSEPNNESLKEIQSNTNLDQNSAWQFLTNVENAQTKHKSLQSIQPVSINRSQSHRVAKKKKSVPKVACDKVRSLQNCLILDPTSRKSSLSTREQQHSSLRNAQRFPVKVFDLLQKIHLKDSKQESQRRRDSQQRRDSQPRRESLETIQDTKLFGKGPAQSLNRTINESFEDNLELSVVEETKSILKK